MKLKKSQKQNSGSIFRLLVGLLFIIMSFAVNAQTYYNGNSRLSTTVRETDTHVFMEVFAIGPFTANSIVQGFFYNPTVLTPLDTNMATFTGSGSFIDISKATRLSPALVDKDFVVVDALSFIGEAGEADHPHFSGNKNMKALSVALIADNVDSVVTVATGEILPLFVCTFAKSAALSYGDFGIAGNDNDDVALFGYSPNWSYGPTVTYLLPVNYGLGTYSKDSTLFLYRSPSSVVTDSVNEDITSAILYGSLSTWELAPTDTLADNGTDFGSNPNYPSSEYKNGRLRGDSVMTRGFIYTLAKDNDVQITYSEFNKTLLVGTVPIKIHPDSLADGAHSFIANGKTFYMVSESNSAYNKGIPYNKRIANLMPETAYYAWAFDLYKFETSVIFPAVGDRIPFITKPCDVDVRSIYIVDNPGCGTNEGKLYVEVSGGIGEYIVAIEKDGVIINTINSYKSTDTIKGLSAGTYRLHIQDIENLACVVISEPITLIAPAGQLRVTASVEHESNCNSGDGAILLQFAGGTGTVEYFLNGVSKGTTTGTTAKITGLTSGVYFVQAVDNTSCDASTGEIIIGVENSTFAVADAVTVNDTCGKAAGELQLTITDGTAPFQYRIDGGVWKTTTERTITIGGLVAGEHVWEVIDADSCSYDTGRSIILNKDNTGFIATVTSTDVGCALNDGTIALTVTGGTAPYTYSYNSSAPVAFNGPSDTIKNLTVGNYDVTVTDATNCSFVIQNSIIGRTNDLMIGTISIVSYPTCATTPSGSIYVKVSGGSGVYQYAYTKDGGALTAYANLDPSGIIAVNGVGTYRVSIIDKNNRACGTVISEVVILESLGSDVTLLTSSTNASDCDQTDGSIYFEMIGEVVNPVKYTLNGVAQTTLNNVKTGTISGLAPGTYVLLAEDANCHVPSREIIIGSASGSLAINVTSTTKTICGVAEGAFELTITGGTAPYQYRVSGGEWSSSLNNVVTVSGLAAGDHVWEVKDSAACHYETGRISILNSNNDVFKVTATHTDAGCTGDNGTITLTVAGGSGEYTYSYNGNTPVEFDGATVTITGLKVGNYDVTVADRNSNCTFVYQNINIGLFKDLNIGTINIVALPTACASDGEIYISVTGGSGSYEYSFDNFATTPTALANDTIRNAAPGTYRIWVRDVNADYCGTVVSEPITLIAPENDLAVYVTSENASSCGNKDGKISYVIDGGTPAYNSTVTLTSTLTGVSQDYTLTGNSGLIENLPGGAYVLSVLDANNCKATSEEIIVTPNSKLNVIVKDSMDAQCGVANGIITITVGTGVTPFYYQLDGGAWIKTYSKKAVISGLKAGDHAWRVMTNDTCYVEGKKEILNSDASSFTVEVTPTNASCDGLDGGTLSIDVTGGTAPFEYSMNKDTNWVTFFNDTTVFNLSVGSYDVVVRDANGCEYEFQNARIKRETESNLIAGTIKILSQPTACGSTTGEIYLNVTGGDKIQYSINGGAWINKISDTIKGLSAGTFNIDIRDSLAIACGNTVSETITLSNTESAMVLTIVSVTDADGCGSGATTKGEIEVLVIGGVTPLTYSLDGVAVTLNANNKIGNVTAGLHIVAVKDADGCVASAEVWIGSGNNGMTVVDNVTANTECNKEDGKISLTITNGTAPYQYQIDGKIVKTTITSPIIITGLSAGTHTWKVTSADGCFATDTIKIINTDNNIIVDVTTTDALCDGLDGGTMKISVTGGTAPYTYTLDTGKIWVSFTNTDTILKNMSVGAYDVVVKDATGCTYEFQDAKIGRETKSDLVVGTIEAISQPTCANNNEGSIYIKITGSKPEYYYSLNDANGTYKPIKAGGDTIKGLSADTYTIFVRDNDALSCGVVESNSIVLHNTDNTMNLIVTTTASVANCGDATGELTVEITDGTAPYTIKLNDVEKANGNAGFLVIGGLTSGSYIVDVTDANSCLISSGEILMIPTGTGLDVAAAPLATTTCDKTDGTLTLTINNNTAQAPFTYTVDGLTSVTTAALSYTFTDLAAGYYEWKVQSSDACLAIGDAEIRNGTKLNFTASIIPSNASCDGLVGGTMKITVANGTAPYTYLLGDGKTGTISADKDTVITGLAMGVYDVTITDNGGCSFMVHNVEIGRDPILDLQVSTIAVAQQPTCIGGDGKIYLAVTGGSGNYIYSQTINGTYVDLINDTIAGLSAGTYTFYIKDKNALTCGVAVSNSITLKVTNSDLKLEMVANNATTCATADGTLTFTVTGGISPYTYNLNGNTPTITGNTINGLAKGSYVLTVTDSDGCSASSKAIFIGADNNSFTATPSLVKNAECNKSTGAFAIKLSANQEYIYQIDGGLISTATTDSIVVRNLPAGNYTWWVMSADSCNRVEGDFTIINHDSPDFMIDVIPTNALCDGSTNGSLKINVTKGTAPFAYVLNNSNNWISFSGNDTTITINGLSMGTYDVTVKDAVGCTYEVRDTEIKIDADPDFEIGTIRVVTQPTCNNTDGEILLVVTGGTGNYEYSLNNDGNYDPLNTIDTLKGLHPGSYRIYVRDRGALACGTLISEMITINPSDAGISLKVTANDATACGTSDGSLSFILNGGTQPFSYTLNGTSVTPVGNTINNLKPGIYVLDVTDAGNCLVSSGDVILTAGTNGIIADAKPVAAAACNAATGVFDLIVKGGSAPYTYQVTGQSVQMTTSDSIRVTGLIAGTHNWWIMGADSCITNGEVVIGNSADPTYKMTASTTNAQCDATSGTITIAVAGGAGNYAYSLDRTNWTPMAEDTVTIIANIGIYDVMVKDGNGCIIEYNNAEIKPADDLIPPTITSPQTFCQGATIANITVQQGTGIVWYDAPVNGNLLPTTTVLQDEKIYYAAQKIGNCESSSRTAVKIYLDTVVLVAPNLGSPQYLCAPATIEDIAIPANLNPLNLTWYASEMATTDIPTTTPLTDNTYYYVELNAGGSCVSVTRSAVLVIFTNTIGKDTNFVSPQYFCEGAVIGNIETPTNKVAWYSASTGGDSLSENLPLVDGKIYYAAQIAGNCTSTERTPVQVFLTVPDQPTALATQAFCNLGTATIADLRVTGSGIVWTDRHGNKLPLTTILKLDSTYYAAQSSGSNCISATIGITVVDGCFDVGGSVFPFVHWDANAPFNALFPVVVSLYELPSSGDTTPVKIQNYLMNATPVVSTLALNYVPGDPTTPFFNGIPKNPGDLGLLNNPGLEIDFSAIGKVRGTPDPRTLQNDSDIPEGIIGVYYFNDVPNGNYIIRVYRAGFLPRYGYVEIHKDTVLGHRELIPGDVNYTNTVDGADYSFSINNRYTHPHPNYAPRFDFDGNGRIESSHDIQLIRFFFGGRYNELYKETIELFNRRSW